MHQFTEHMINDNGKLILKFFFLIQLRIHNTFFYSKAERKFTFNNSEDQQSIIDCIVIDIICMPPSEILDDKSLNTLYF